MPHIPSLVQQSRTAGKVVVAARTQADQEHAPQKKMVREEKRVFATVFSLVPFNPPGS